MLKQKVNNFMGPRGRRSTIIDALKVGKFALATVLVLAVAVTAKPPEEPIEQLASRAGPAPSFVPRLGKRLDQSQQRVDSLERVLCASSQDCSRLALLGATVKGMSGRDGLALLSAPSITAPGLLDQLSLPGNQFKLIDGQVYLVPPSEPTGNEPTSLFDMLAALGPYQQRSRQLFGVPRRATRASELIDEDGALSSSNLGGSKRVAFTPRIGRRRR